MSRTKTTKVSLQILPLSSWRRFWEVPVRSRLCIRSVNMPLSLAPKYDAEMLTEHRDGSNFGKSQNALEKLISSDVWFHFVRDVRSATHSIGVREGSKEKECVFTTSIWRYRIFSNTGAMKFKFNCGSGISGKFQSEIWVLHAFKLIKFGGIIVTPQKQWKHAACTCISTLSSQKADKALVNRTSESGTVGMLDRKKGIANGYHSRMCMSALCALFAILLTVIFTVHRR